MSLQRILAAAALVAAVIAASAASPVQSATPVASAEIGADQQTVSPTNSSTSVAPTSDGATLKVTVADSSAATSYAWHVTLGTGESLQMLANGSVAVVAPYNPFPGGEDDGTGDAYAANEASSSTAATTSPDSSTVSSASTIAPDGSPVDGSIPPTDPVYAGEVATTGSPSSDDAALDPGEPSSSLTTNVDPTYPDADALAARDGLTLLNDAQDAVDGRLVAIVAAPSAVDATGAVVSSTLTAGADSVTIDLAPSSTASYPLAATADVAFASTDGSATATSDGPTLNPSSCPTLGRVLTFNPNGWGTLLGAMAAYPATCTRYSIAVPPLVSNPRAFQSGLAANIRSRNSLGTVTTARSKFFAAATLVWKNWNLDDSRVDPYKVGQTFRKRMADAKFSVTSGDTWVIDEIPASVRTNSTTRGRFLQLIKGLYNGPSGWRKAAGMAFVTVEYQNGTPIDPATYKTQWKTLLATSTFWNSLRPYLNFWSQEVYTYCLLVCDPRQTLGQKAAHTNAYVQHPARLAYAPDAPSTAASARGFFDVGYQPIENAWWATAQTNPSYQTQSLGGDRMQRFASLQIFATRAWAEANAYPDRRVGLAWNQHPPATAAARQALARRIALALRGAYSLNGSARYACDLTGVSTRLCNPALDGASFREIWSGFGSWN